LSVLLVATVDIALHGGGACAGADGGSCPACPVADGCRAAGRHAGRHHPKDGQGRQRRRTGHPPGRRQSPRTVPHQRLCRRAAGQAVPELAQAGGVRWVSLDAPTVSSSIDGSTAQRPHAGQRICYLGHPVGHGAPNHVLQLERGWLTRRWAPMVPAARALGSWAVLAGLSPRSSRGTSSKKWSCAARLHGGSSVAHQVLVYFNGMPVRQVTVPGSIFDSVVGSAMTGPVYRDPLQRCSEASLSTQTALQNTVGTLLPPSPPAPSGGLTSPTICRW